MFALSPRRSSFPLCLFAFVVALVSNSTAQHPKVLAPHRAVPPRISENERQPLPLGTTGSMVGGPWITDANFKSSIYLKNVVTTDSITVTPILYLSNG